MIIRKFETNPLIYQNKISNHFEDTEISKINIFEYQANTIFEDRNKTGINEKKFFREVMGAINQQIKVTDHPCGLILQTFLNYIINYTGPQVWFRDLFTDSEEKRITHYENVIYQ
ncbi:unnamed protein product (macronuclear) [Paramecium tetraurelia]|uniref:Uncharacterized protein n=1 Tax=Paramecium tetraurelia TaxID=5888 RepID=A0DP17_PARTE|nr:uncharacterized protein GSPATT00018980001 [Paramecium tetraurelia]CAK84784.1 unnamed protein product [Paramecium tetraurelia]|eukprot:XP_001452181.1 hypothetical protein (macronuclear) [Paramecium tetraurelia strain d4-2]